MKKILFIFTLFISVSAFSPSVKPPNDITMKGEFAEWNNVILQLQNSIGPHVDVVRAINFIYNQYPDSIKAKLK